MDNKNKPCALASFMKLLKSQSLSNVKEIVIVDDNARRRRSSCRRLGNALKGGAKCPQRRSFRKSQRWESSTSSSSLGAAAPSSASALAPAVNKKEAPMKRRVSGIFCPQRRASIERRESIDSDTSVCSAASADLAFLDQSSPAPAPAEEPALEQPLPAYNIALQMISQKYATPTSAATALTPPTRRPSYGDIQSKGSSHQQQQAKQQGRGSGIKL
ncbi:unnamed protein product [Cylindrotheca closterium]|uniref:Uncharacterized protein n=1 Tax=Cylindrotheca closterium TaxID=2856 RepID=A0AAD2GBE5_9STRA|nr:unnamed protein product [Cylindrotheca closterium]